MASPPNLVDLPSATAKRRRADHCTLSSDTSLSKLFRRAGNSSLGLVPSLSVPPGDSDGFEGEGFDGRKQAVYGAFATALSQLRDEGLFDPQIGLFVNISDAGDDELAVMRKIISEINPQPLARTLSGCELNDETLTSLLHSNLLTGVENLELLSNQLTDKGIIALAQSSSIGNLTYLELSSNPFGAEGITALANRPNLSKLGELKLGSIEIGSNGVQALVNSPYLQKIYWLWIGKENGLTDADRQELKHRFQDAAAGFKQGFHDNLGDPPTTVGRCQQQPGKLGRSAPITS